MNGEMDRLITYPLSFKRANVKLEITGPSPIIPVIISFYNTINITWGDT